MMPHSIPCSTWPTSSLKRRNPPIFPSKIWIESRTSRTRPERLIDPSVTMQPATDPALPALNVWRTSALPSAFSMSVGARRPGMADRDAHLFGGQLGERVRHGFDRTLDVGLDDEPQLELVGFGHAFGEIFQRNLGAGGDEVLDLRFAAVRDFLGLLGVLDDVQGVARIRYVGKAEQLHGRGGPRLGDVAPQFIGHRANFAPRRAGDHDVADVQR